MLIGNKIFTCSSGHPILYSELPVYDDPKKYNELLKNKYQIKNGQADFYGNKIITKGKENIIINKEFKFNSSINIYTNVMPNILSNCGLIFGFENYDDNKNNYYFFIINKEGYISLKKRNKNKLENIFPLNDSIHFNYNKENVYKMNIKYNCTSNEIITLVNDREINLLNKFFHIF